MIEFLPQSDRNFVLSVNNRLLENTKVSRSTEFNSEKVFYEIHSSNPEFYEIVKDYLLSDFPPLYLINFLIIFKSINESISTECWFISEENSKTNEDKLFKVSIDFGASLKDWTNNFAFSQFFNELKKIIDKRKDLEISMNDNSGGLEYGFLIEQVKIEKGSQKISSVSSDFFKKINSLILEVNKKLNILNSERSSLISFDFPEELKIACEQYLLYFAQFLQDLGINATSNLKEEAGKVLFSVTPTDDVEALDKIREALAMYLNLPASPIVYNDSFAAMRLQQQIENLQHSQRMTVRELQFNEKLLIAQSDTIREKNITILQQQSVIENQSKIIEKISSKSIMMDSVENKEELEEICDGLKIGKSKLLMEQLGIHLNPATFAKSIGKKILSKQEEISILDLSEEKEEKIER